ncbi:MAG: four-helix bundle copper-binding protein [Isosphaeraceae bacterium]
MWKRRELLGVLGTGAAGLAFLTNRSEAAGQAPASKDAHAGHDPRHAEIMKECDEACGHCEAACNLAFHHCITQAAAGKVEHAKMAQLVVDCAAFCTLSAAMIARHSSLMMESCRACAEACRRCAEECGSVANDDTMKACAIACRKCEESCRNMIRVMGGEHHHEK